VLEVVELVVPVMVVAAVVVVVPATVVVVVAATVVVVVAATVVVVVVAVAFATAKNAATRATERIDPVCGMAKRVGVTNV
jgi:type III secretory pathway component EscU